MAKWIYSMVIEEWNEKDGYERMEIRGSYGTFKKALSATRKLIDNMLHGPYATYSVIDDRSLAEFHNPCFAELYLEETGLHIRYPIVSNQLY